ncbi:hypothetical protein FQA39_LY02761 [Lamprigera yunnana]|nr:hypothetical protein FQA39_LY02761 [Lamprigera yunnana]
MDRKKKPSGAFKCKQRQKSEDSKQKLPKIDKFFSQPSASTSGQNISIDSDSNNVVTAVLIEKPTEEDSTIIAVGYTSAADHVNVDDVCMAHRRAEDLDEPQTSTFFENVYDKSSYDLGNFTNKILSDDIVLIADNHKKMKKLVEIWIQEIEKIKLVKVDKKPKIAKSFNKRLPRKHNSRRYYNNNEWSNATTLLQSTVNCPKGLTYHEDFGVPLCYILTEKQRYPPNCPYTNSLESDSILSVYNKFENEIIWARARRNLEGQFGEFEWLDVSPRYLDTVRNYKIMNNTITDKNCMVYLNRSLVAVSCEEQHPALCIYSFHKEVVKRFCSKHNNFINCISTSFNLDNKCYCQATTTGLNVSRSTYCQKFAEPDPFQNHMLITQLSHTVPCWFGVENNNGILSWSSTKQPITYNYWSTNTNFSNQYGAMDYKNQSWILTEDNSLQCAICEIDVAYQNTSIFLEHVPNTNQIRVSIKNLFNIHNYFMFDYILACFSDYESSSIKKKVTSSISDLIPITSPSFTRMIKINHFYPAYYWCETIQRPNLTRVFSNKILVHNDIGKHKHEYSLTVVVSVPTGVDPYLHNLHIKTAQFVSSRLLEFSYVNIVRPMRITKFLEKAHKMEVIIHLSTSESGLSANIEYEELLNVLQRLPRNDTYEIARFYRSEVCLESTTTSASTILHWPEAFIRKTIIPRELCLLENSRPVTRTCEGDFLFGAKWTDVNGSCYNKNINERTLELYTVLYNETGEDQISSHLLNLTKNATNVLVVDVHLISEILQQLQKDFKFDFISVIEIISNIMSYKKDVMQEAQILLNSTDITLHEFDLILNKAKLVRKENFQIIRTDNILVQISILKESNIRGAALRKVGNDSKNSFQNYEVIPLTNRSLENILHDRMDLVVFLSDNLMEEIISYDSKMNNSGNLVISFLINDVLFNEIQETNNTDQIVTNVLVPSSKSRFKNPLVVITKLNTTNKNFECVHWKYGLNDMQEHIQGSWVTDDLPNIQTKRNIYAICKYDHATHFSLLVSTRHSQIQTPEVKLALNIITLIGCGLSLIGLTGIFMIGIFFKSWRKRTRNIIMLNFSGALTLQLYDGREKFLHKHNFKELRDQDGYIGGATIGNYRENYIENIYSTKLIKELSHSNEHDSLPIYVSDDVGIINESTENLPLEPNLSEGQNYRLESKLHRENIKEHIKEVSLNDDKDVYKIHNYDKKTLPKCPIGLASHQGSNNEIICYKITEPSRFPPPCPYPLNIDRVYFKSINKLQLTNNVVWAYAQKEDKTNSFEWLYDVQDNFVPINYTNLLYSSEKRCLVINETELVPVSCEEKYHGICIYSFENSTLDNFCKRRLNETCFSSSFVASNHCFCINRFKQNLPRNSYCAKLADLKNPYQNYLVARTMYDDEYCWFDFEKEKLITKATVGKYDYDYWFNRNDFSKPYGAVGKNGWILQNDGHLSCAICQVKIENLTDARLSLKRNFTTNRIQLEIFNALSIHQGVLCVTGSDSRFINLSSATETYLLQDLWLFSEITEYCSCKALQLPTFSQLRSNMITARYTSISNIFVALWSFPMSAYDVNDNITSCSGVNKSIIIESTIVKKLVVPEDDKIQFLCHYYVASSNLSTQEQYVLLKKVLTFENGTLESLNNLMVCLPSTTISGSKILHWNKTSRGSTIIPEELCLDKNAEPVTRTCGGNVTHGAKWLPVNGSCLDVPISSTTFLLNDLLHKQSSTNHSVATSLLNIIKTKTDMNAFQIHLVSQILQKISEDVKNIQLKDIVKTLNDIMNFEPSKLRGSQEKLNSTDTILWCLDEILLHTRAGLDNDVYVSEGSDKLLMQATNLMTSDIKGFKVESSSSPVFNTSSLKPLRQYSFNEILKDGVDLAVMLPQELHNSIISCEGSKNEPTMITSMFYDDCLFNEIEQTGRTDGRILGVLIPGFNCTFSSPIKVIFKSSFEQNLNIQCASWAYGSNELNESIRGHWKVERDSIMIEDFPQYRLCEYTHVTHFALLVLGDGINISNEQEVALNIITAVGSGLSILGLFGVFFTAFLFKVYRAANGIVINFSIAVVAQIILLYIAHHASHDKVACIIFGALLHYIVLSQFFWMLTIAVLQYQRYVVIFSSPPSHLVAKACLFSWGIPLLPIIIIVSISTDNYGKNPNGLCYALGNFFVFGVLIPIATIIVINVAIFLRIMISISSSRRIKVHQERGSTSVLQLRLAFMLFFLLGLTWGFGLLASAAGSIVYSYCFCVTATLQGFVIFLFFIVLNEKTRNLWINLKSCCRKSEEYDVNRDSSNSVMMRRPKTISSDTCTDSTTSEILKKVKARRSSEV